MVVALTRLVEHLVALVKYEDTNTAETKGLVAHEGLETAGGTDDDVGTGILVLQCLHIRLDGSTAVEDTSLDVRHVLAETVVLIANLVGQLSSVAHNNDRDLAVDGLNLLQSSKNKDCGLSQSGLGLADNISSKKRLGNACLLDCRSRGR